MWETFILTLLIEKIPGVILNDKVQAVLIECHT